MTREKRKRLSLLEEKIDTYFGLCDDANNEKKNIIKPYTLSGLLSFTELSREEFEKLLTSKTYGEVIRKAKGQIEAFIEENMLTGELSCNASLNSLKYNFGWGEKERESEKSDRTITVTLSPEMNDLAG